jgi:uncharacterized protein YjeT (DUF2065 family)
MPDLIAAIGLALVIEGILMTLFPGGMRRWMAALLERPASELRAAGLASAIIGLGVVWLARL